MEPEMHMTVFAIDGELKAMCGFEEGGEHWIGSTRRRDVKCDLCMDMIEAAEREELLALIKKATKEALYEKEREDFQLRSNSYPHNYAYPPPYCFPPGRMT